MPLAICSKGVKEVTLNMSIPLKLSKMRKCLCGYETRRNDNFVRHLKRKTTWCDEVMVSAVIEKNGDEQMILFYYKMIDTKKDFAIWIRNMRRVNQHFIYIRDSDTEIEESDTQIEDTPITKEINDIPIQNKLKTEHTIEINKYIDGIKRFFKVGERYAIEVKSAKLNIPMFFYIKEINEQNIIIEYVKIDFLKIGTGEATIAPLWDEIKEERIIKNKDIINIYPFDEQKKYRYNSYCYIRNDVRTFYGIVNKR